MRRHGMTEAAAFAAIGEAIGWWWANLRLWALEPDVTVSSVALAFWNQARRDSERDRNASSCGFFQDAVAHGRASKRADAAADAVNDYPHLWPVFAELLHDDDPHTWETRVAAKAAELYPGEGVEP